MTTEDRTKILEFLDSNLDSFHYDGRERHSVLIHILKDCRKFTERNEKTGKFKTTGHPAYFGSWLGALGYLCVLDMLGNAFKNKGDTPTGNRIGFAIESFASDLINNDDGDIDALIALRNSFAHNLSLLNIPYDSKKEPAKTNQTQRFTVDAKTDDENVIMRRRTVPWDGNPKTKDFDRYDDLTLVNLFALGTFVEKIYERIQKGIAENSIVPQDNDLLSFLNRYTFVESR